MDTGEETRDEPAKSIFLGALDIDSTQDRRDYIDRRCDGDAALRAEVETLLRHHEGFGDFLERPVLGPVATREFAVTLATGGSAAVVGPYRLLQEIGEGGMGTVYMAEQESPVRRTVALKLIRPGMDSRQVIARFEAERQALALMDHPNIAKVLDAGATEQGRPYFVMELVKGVPITRFCDEARLTLRGRLELFTAVCQAVQHAHQKGVIHRDLKPSNVMVALYDGKPVPKVIDFGVAKATGERLTEATLQTGFGMIVGTPEYMSPEQAELNQLDVDTRSDVYSLGVLLYELLTGTTPLQHGRIRRTALAEVLRLVREEEPPKPSRRLSSTERLPSIAANRNIEPRRLTGLVRGELDWIVMKALEKDRDRRYDSANSLAGDVRRYLDDEQVSACPPSTRYRLRKFARRHKGEVLAASLLALTLVGGIIGTTWGLIRATEAQSVAVDETRRKEDALKDKILALTAARRSKRDADEKLFASYVDQSRAIRTGRRPGQRFESLAVLRRAADLARTLGLRDAMFHDLRNAAIAAMALPDLSTVGPRHPWPDDALGADIDDSEVLYVRTDRRGSCSIRRVADDAELYRLPGLGKLANPHLSRDGKYLVVSHFVNGPARQPTSVQLWELGSTAARLIRSEDGAYSSAFRVKPPQVALAYTDGSIRLFELPSGRRIGHLPPVAFTRELQIALHPTEPTLAVASYFESGVQLRDLTSGAVIAAQPQERRPTGLAWRPDGRALAIGYEHGPIRLYDPAALQPVRTLETLQTVTGLAFNAAGDRLAATGWGGGVSLFDVGTARNLFSSGLSTGMLRISPDGRRLAAALEEGRLASWRIGDGREFRTLVRQSLPMRTGVATREAVSPHGRLVAAAMPDGIGLWDLTDGGELVFIPMGEDGFRNLVLFEPSGALLTLGPTGLSRWPVERGPSAPGRLIVGPPERLPLPPGGAIDQSRDGRVIVVCCRAAAGEQFSAGGWILHADRPDRPIHLDQGADIEWIAVSPDGRWVVTVDHTSGASKIWDARDGRPVKTLAEWGAGFPRFSPDGRWLSTDLDGGLIVSVGTWEPGPRIGGAGAISPDGTLAAVPSGHLIRLVDPATGRELAVLEDPNLDTAYLPLFTPDGANLIVSSAVSVVHVWDLRLIRRNLAEMGLDWDAPAYAPAEAARTVEPPLSVEVRLGDSARPAPMDEEQARRVIDGYRRALGHDPDRAEACNNLAWAYLTGPASLRDVEAAVPLAEKAVRLDPANSIYGNTLGVAYYRAGRYREAVEILRANIDRQEDWALAFDLYFLAMSRHRQGEFERARDYYDWAGRWTRASKGLSPGRLEALDVVRTEASEVLGVAVKDGAAVHVPGRALDR